MGEPTMVLSRYEIAFEPHKKLETWLPSLKREIVSLPKKLNTFFWKPSKHIKTQTEENGFIN
jgi:hypothetical protein